MTLDIVREYIAANDSKMYGARVDKAPATGWIGHEAKEGPALFPETLRAELKRRGYELDAVIPGWLEQGALVTNPKSQPPHLLNRRTAGNQARHLVFRREVLDLPDQDGDE